MIRQTLAISTDGWKNKKAVNNPSKIPGINFQKFEKFRGKDLKIS
jgi:hypothetical protein